MLSKRKPRFCAPSSKSVVARERMLTGTVSTWQCFSTADVASSMEASV